jgi:hypothetical protein
MQLLPLRGANIVASRVTLSSFFGTFSICASCRRICSVCFFFFFYKCRDIKEESAKLHDESPTRLTSEITTVEQES